MACPSAISAADVTADRGRCQPRDAPAGRAEPGSLSDQLTVAAPSTRGWMAKTIVVRDGRIVEKRPSIQAFAFREVAVSSLDDLGAAVEEADRPAARPAAQLTPRSTPRRSCQHQEPRTARQRGRRGMVMALRWPRWRRPVSETGPSARESATPPRGRSQRSPTQKTTKPVRIVEDGTAPAAAAVDLWGKMDDIRTSDGP